MLTHTCRAATRTRAALLVAAALSGACGDTPSPAADDVVITSDGGITTVTSAGLHVADTAAWRIVPEPVVRIGEVEGAPEYTIGKLAGMLLRPDGSIVIADAIAHELRVFDGTGRFVRKVGRKGEGPGEFAWMSGMYAFAGDSVIVADGEGGRLNILDPELNFVRRERPRLQETVARAGMTSHSVRGFFADGSLLMSDYLSVCDAQRRDGGFCTDSSAYYRVRGEGPAQASFGRFASARNEMIRLRPGFSTGWSEPHPQAFTVARGDRFYYADAAAFEVRVFRADGRLERIVRVAAPAPRYTHDEVFARWPDHGAEEDARRREARLAWEQAAARARVPDPLPQFSDMLVDDTGRIWLREFQPPALRDAAPPRWFIFDAEGRLRYALRSPPGLVRPPVPWPRHDPQIGEDFILAALTDELGVESVVLYRLEKRRP